MPEMLGYLLLFTGVGAAFVLVNLTVGKLIRPAKMNPEKATIYECGEPTIGSAWIQFDLRFYVVALLFVIFDVEMAFFFPWAVVFGKANELTNPSLPVRERAAITAELQQSDTYGPATEEKINEVEASFQKTPVLAEHNARAASTLAWIGFADIAVFFGVLIVAFAYLWKRGDLDWVRSTAAQKAAARPREELLLVVKD